MPALSMYFLTTYGIERGLIGLWRRVTNKLLWSTSDRILGEVGNRFGPISVLKAGRWSLPLNPSKPLHDGFV